MVLLRFSGYFNENIILPFGGRVNFDLNITKEKEKEKNVLSKVNIWSLICKRN